MTLRLAYSSVDQENNGTKNCEVEEDIIEKKRKEHVEKRANGETKSPKKKKVAFKLFSPNTMNF